MLSFSSDAASCCCGDAFFRVMLFLAVVKLFRVMLCLAVVVIIFSNDAVLRDAVSSCCFFLFFVFVL